MTDWPVRNLLRHLGGLAERGGRRCAARLLIGLVLVAWLGVSLLVPPTTALGQGLMPSLTATATASAPPVSATAATTAVPTTPASLLQTIPEACHDNPLTPKCLLPLLEEYGWIKVLVVGIPVILIFVGLVSFVQGFRKGVEERGKRFFDWLTSKLRRRGSDPTRTYLMWFIKQYEDPKYGPMDLGRDMGRPPAKLKEIYLPIEVTFEATEEERARLREAAGIDSLREGKTISLLEALETSQRLVIIGKPGSGKSTLLQWLGLVCAHRCLKRKLEGQDEVIRALGASLLPVFISLSAFDRYCENEKKKRCAVAMLDFVTLRYQTHHQSAVIERQAPPLPDDFFDRKLRQGCLLLFDGMDEVPPERRREVRHAIEEFLDRYKDSRRMRALITARPSAKGQAQISASRLGEIEPLDPERRNALIDKLYTYYEPNRAGERTASLINRLEIADERVKELATTPLLVTIFTLIHRPGHELPNQRAEVYEEAIKTLLYDLHRKLTDEYPLASTQQSQFDPAVLRERLALIAFHLHKAGRSEEGMLEGDLIDLILPDLPDLAGGEQEKRQKLSEFLYAVAYRGGLLEEDDRHFGFRTHRSFQEYLAGWYLVRQYAPQNLERQGEFIAERLTDDHWVEPIRLAAGYLAISGTGEVNHFLRKVMELGKEPRERDHAVALAGLCLYDLAEERPHRDVREELASHMKEVLERNPPTLPTRLRAEVGLALGKLRDPDDKNRLFDTRIHVGGVPELVRIPAGTFRMGTSPEDERRLSKQNTGVFDDEKPAHLVTISYDYWIGKYPVTNAEFDAFVRAGGYDLEKWGECWSEDGRRWRNGTSEWRPLERRERPFYWDDERWNAPNQPVVGVTWFEAEAYCNWLSAVTGERFRLPSEAEWERAARAAVAPDQGDQPAYYWPWGDVWEADRCNSGEGDERLGRTTPVGIYPHGASPCGALDMAGNVWEWCRDWYDDEEYQRRLVSGAPVVDPPGAPTGQARVVRGGAWYDLRINVRCAVRFRYEPDDFYDFVGFRLVRSPA